MDAPTSGPWLADFLAQLDLSQQAALRGYLRSGVLHAQNASLSLNAGSAEETPVPDLLDELARACSALAAARQLVLDAAGHAPEAAPVA